MSAHGPARKSRLESLLRREIATSLLTLVDDPRLRLVTITRVEMTGDLHQARAFWTIIGPRADRRHAAAALEAVRVPIQNAYAKAVRTRLLPILSFAYDEQEQRRSGMDDLIRRARASDPDQGQVPTPPAPQAATGAEPAAEDARE
jgi:ribosome-binding factor A